MSCNFLVSCRFRFDQIRKMRGASFFPISSEGLRKSFEIHSCRPMTSQGFHKSADEKLKIEIFSDILMTRHSAQSFEPTEVSLGTLQNIMKLTQRAPSSFNVQPFACVIVDGEKRQELSECMLGERNASRVKSAPHTAVFLADTDTVGKAARVARWLREEHGGDPSYLARMPHMVGMFSGGGSLGYCLKESVFTGMSPLKAMPSTNSSETWAFKNTMLFVQNFMLSCTAHGLATAPMEGFDGRRIKVCLDIPRQYSIPVVIPFGYSKDAHQTPSPRLSPQEVFFRNSFGKGFMVTEEMKNQGVDIDDESNAAK